MSDPNRLVPEACLRNRDPLLAALREVLPPGGLVLEIASGTGQHAAWFTAHLPHLRWQPTDVDEVYLRSVDAWRSDGGPGLLPALRLDVLEPWPVARADAVYCANMIHIAPWVCAEALVAGAGRVLPPGAPLVLYGPFRRAGVATAPTNEAFDASLRARDASWGLRDLETIDGLARQAGFGPPDVVELPANNVLVAWRKAPVASPPSR